MSYKSVRLKGIGLNQRPCKKNLSLRSFLSAKYLLGHIFKKFMELKYHNIRMNDILTFLLKNDLGKVREVLFFFSYKVETIIFSAIKC